MYFPDIHIGWSMFFSPDTQLSASAPMKRVFCSLKSKWVPENGYGSLSEATKDISSYLMEYCNQRRPHSYYQDLTPAEAENRLNVLSGIF